MKFCNFKELDEIIKSEEYFLFQVVDGYWQNKGYVMLSDNINHYKLIHKNNRGGYKQLNFKEATDAVSEDDSFSRFEFSTPAFHAEILKKVGNTFVGYVINKSEEVSTIRWDINGVATGVMSCYSLEKKHKPMYLNLNFPCLLADKITGEFLIVYGYSSTTEKYTNKYGIDILDLDEVRILTESEKLKLFKDFKA